MGIRPVFGLACLCVLSLCSSLRCFGQGSDPALFRPFTIEQVMSSPCPTNLVASAPSASHPGRIAWVFAVKGERNVWTADAPNFEARKVTHYVGDDGMPIASLKLTPDGRTVV